MIAAYIDGEPVEMSWSEAREYNIENGYWDTPQYEAQQEYYYDSCERLRNTECPKCHKVNVPCMQHGQYHVIRIQASGVATLVDKHGSLRPDHLSHGPFPYIAKDWLS